MEYERFVPLRTAMTNDWQQFNFPYRLYYVNQIGLSVDYEQGSSSALQMRVLVSHNGSEWYALPTETVLANGIARYQGLTREMLESDQLCIYFPIDTRFLAISLRVEGDATDAKAGVLLALSRG